MIKFIRRTYSSRKYILLISLVNLVILLPLITGYTLNNCSGLVFFIHTGIVMLFSLFHGFLSVFSVFKLK